MSIRNKGYHSTLTYVNSRFFKNALTIKSKVTASEFGVVQNNFRVHLWYRLIQLEQSVYDWYLNLNENFTGLIDFSIHADVLGNFNLVLWVKLIENSGFRIFYSYISRAYSSPILISFTRLSTNLDTRVYKVGEKSYQRNRYDLF